MERAVTNWIEPTRENPQNTRGARRLGAWCVLNFARVLLPAALIAATALPAQAQRWTLPISVQSKVDSVFAFVDRDAPGCALGVIQDGMLAYGRGYGLANLDWGIPITTSSAFDIGSVSKQFTAAAVALLDVEGALSIDDDVRTWVPELPEYNRPITIRHLLNHTSGVRDYLTLMRLQGFEYDNVFDEFDGVELIARQQGLNFEPGSEFLYSNSGYLLLANIVRRVTGQSLRAFLEERFFDPLGMAHTSIWDENTEIVTERATGYSPTAGGWGIDHAWNFQMGGDGQVITSVDDMVRWDAMFYDPIVGGQDLLARLHTQGLLNNGDTIDYAMGLVVDEYRGLPRVQHGGAWAGFRAYLVRFVDHHTSVALLCNRGDVNTSSLTAQVVDAVLADQLDAESEAAETTEAAGEETGRDEPAFTPTTAQLTGLVGGYRSEELDVSWQIFSEDGEMILMRPGNEPAELRPSAQDEFTAGRLGVTLERDGGRVTGFRVFAGRVTDILFEKAGE
jgi:CubicO group peptidase (beta-lactamase class C family)